MLPLGELNLILTDTWWELISGREVNDLTEELTLAPYQTVWLTNKQY
jgi:sucrose phosphorylase